MTDKLRRNARAALAVAAIFVAYLFANALVVWCEQAPSAGRPSGQIVRIIFDGTLLLLLSGIATSFVLHKFRLRHPGTYLVTGALSGWLAGYCVWFEFGKTWSLFGSRPPVDALSTLMVEIVVGIPATIARMLSFMADQATAITTTVVGAILIGMLCGGLYWLVIVRRATKHQAG